MIEFLIVVSAVFAWNQQELCFSYCPSSWQNMPSTTVPRGCSPEVPEDIKTLSSSSKQRVKQ